MNNDVAEVNNLPPLVFLLTITDFCINMLLLMKDNQAFRENSNQLLLIGYYLLYCIFIQHPYYIIHPIYPLH